MAKGSWSAALAWAGFILRQLGINKENCTCGVTRADNRVKQVPTLAISYIRKAEKAYSYYGIKKGCVDPHTDANYRYVLND